MPVKSRKRIKKSLRRAQQSVDFYKELWHTLRRRVDNWKEEYLYIQGVNRDLRCENRELKEQIKALSKNI